MKKRFFRISEGKKIVDTFDGERSSFSTGDIASYFIRILLQVSHFLLAWSVIVFFPCQVKAFDVFGLQEPPKLEYSAAMFGACFFQNVENLLTGALLEGKDLVFKSSSKQKRGPFEVIPFSQSNGKKVGNTSTKNNPENSCNDTVHESHSLFWWVGYYFLLCIVGIITAVLLNLFLWRKELF